MEKFLRLENNMLSERARLYQLKSFCKATVLLAAEELRSMIVHEFKGTGCVRAEELPVEKADGSLDVVIRQCRPTSIQCRVHDFFSEHIDAFKLLAAAIEAAQKPSGELKKMAQQIRLAEVDPKVLCDGSGCTLVADALIAMDGKTMSAFAANNDAEWILIARTLGINLVNPVKGIMYPGDSEQSVKIGDEMNAQDYTHTT
jgi:hypothetical protein